MWQTKKYSRAKLPRTTKSFPFNQGFVTKCKILGLLLIIWFNITDLMNLKSSAFYESKNYITKNIENKFTIKLFFYVR